MSLPDALITIGVSADGCVDGSRFAPADAVLSVGVAARRSPRQHRQDARAQEPSDGRYRAARSVSTAAAISAGIAPVSAIPTAVPAAACLAAQHPHQDIKANYAGDCDDQAFIHGVYRFLIRGLRCFFKMKHATASAAATAAVATPAGATAAVATPAAFAPPGLVIHIPRHTAGMAGAGAFGLSAKGIENNHAQNNNGKDVRHGCSFRLSCWTLARTMSQTKPGHLRSAA